MIRVDARTTTQRVVRDGRSVVQAILLGAHASLLNGDNTTNVRWCSPAEGRSLLKDYNDNAAVQTRGQDLVSTQSSICFISLQGPLKSECVGFIQPESDWREE